MSESIAIPTVNNQKFGTFLGVYVPCILMIFGVIIFLRLGWIVGVTGLPTALAIITFAAVIALVTVVSMAAISTNIEVGTGGVYYIVSRSLGIEAGAAVGIPLYFKQSLSIAFCTIGFAESLHDLIPQWSITTIGMGALGVLSLLAYFSISGALKVQVAIFIAIIASFISLFTGSSLIPVQEANFTSTAPISLGFWAVFSIFFPAMTGMESSVSLSGDLRNPSRSLPLGTILAILTGWVCYVAIAIFLTYQVPMQRLIEEPFIMQSLATIPSLIIVGIWGATLSSAIGGLLGAPRTLQAISDDGIAPKIFGRTFGPMNEPKVATLVTCALSFIAVYFGSIDIIAPLMTMITLICYLVLNLAAGIETLMANPSWRPRFYVHWSISFAGAALCLIAMLMIDAGSALLALALVSLIYFLVKSRKFQSSWDDICDGILLFFSRKAIYKLLHLDSQSKSWRPHFLVFTKASETQANSLLSFSEAISQSKSFLTMTSFVEEGVSNHQSRKELSVQFSHKLRERNIDAFVQIKETSKVTSGMQQMIEHYGLGPLTPNTIVFGGVKKEDESKDFVEVLRAAFIKQFNIVIMRETKKPTSGDIHVWWDERHNDNSELMLVFAIMLKQNSAWKKTQIRLKVIAANEAAREKKRVELQKLCFEKRLPIDVEILIAPEESFEIVFQTSAHAGIVFMGLTPPPLFDEDIEEYLQYLNTLSIPEGFPSVALVLNSGNTPLRHILS